MTTRDAQRAAGAPLLAACTAAVSEFLDERLKASFASARDALIAAASEAEGPDDEERFVSAMEQVEALAPQVTEAFTAAVLAKLQAPEAASARPDEGSDGGLALVETAKVDDWLRLRDLLGRHPAAAQTLEAAMWRRLAPAVGASAHPDDNPLSLQGMLMLFQEALKPAAPSRDARNAIYDAFEKDVARRLSVLAARIEMLSDEAEQAAESGGGPAADGPEAGAGVQAAEAGAALSDEGSDGAPGAEPPAEARPQEGVDAGAAPPVEAGPRDVADPGVETTASGEARDGEPERPRTRAPAGAGAAREGVEERVPETAARAGSGATPVADAESAGRPEDSARLIGTLAGAQREDPAALPGTACTAEALAERLESLVVPPGVSLDAEERSAVAAVARIVEQAIAHPDVDEAVARRLWRLAPPMVMLVLQGEEYLALELDGARHDSVTGLLDRESFRGHLERATQEGFTGHAVCLVEVDGFDRICDRLGMQVGARMLRVLGDALRTHAGSAAAVARLRGGEFAVVLRATEPGAGRRLAGRYLDAIAEAHFVVKGEPVDMGVSIGVVEADPRMTTPAAVMGAAHAARQEAKAAGGNCLRVHDSERGEGPGG